MKDKKQELEEFFNKIMESKNISDKHKELVRKIKNSEPISFKEAVFLLNFLRKFIPGLKKIPWNI